MIQKRNTKILASVFIYLIAFGLFHSGVQSAEATEPQTVEYTLTFDSVWSAQTHPQSFPPNPHFSGLVGGTHNNLATFWEVGQLASNGIESMAETGSKSGLISEVNAAITLGTGGAVISGPGIGNSPGSASVTFTATQTFPLATVVTMIAPSPDWFVGVSGVNLFQGGQWVEELVVLLQPFDSGTDNGTNYTSPNSNTNPAEAIFEIMGFPFLDNGSVAPLGTFTFKRNIPQTLTADANTLSAAGGDRVNFDLTAGVENAGRLYLILGSITGTDPGTPLPSSQCVLPINWDNFTNLMLGRLNSPVFSNFFSMLDISGSSTAQLFVPMPIPNYLGRQIHFAYLLDDPFDFVSNPVQVDIVP